MEAKGELERRSPAPRFEQIPRDPLAPWVEGLLDRRVGLVDQRGVSDQGLIIGSLKDQDRPRGPERA